MLEEKLRQRELARDYYKMVIEEEKKRLTDLLKKKEQFKAPSVSVPSFLSSKVGFSSLRGYASAFDWEIARTYEKLGDAFFGLGEYRQAKEMYQKAREYARAYAFQITEGGKNQFELSQLKLSGYDRFYKGVERKLLRASLREK